LVPAFAVQTKASFPPYYIPNRSVTHTETHQLTRGCLSRHYPHTWKMGGLSCYMICTSPKHAARAAQALRPGRSLLLHGRELTPALGDCASFGFQSESPSPLKALNFAALCGLGDHVQLFSAVCAGILCYGLRSPLKTANGPPPNVTGRLFFSPFKGSRARPRAQRHFYLTIQTVALVFAFF